MRIAIVVSRLEVGGLETMLKGLGSVLQRAGHEMVFVETHSRGRWASDFCRNGFCVRDVLPSPARSRVRHARRIAAVLAEYDAVLLNNVPWAQSVLGLLPNGCVAIPVLHTAMSSMVRTAAGSAGEWDAIAAVSPDLQRTITRELALPTGSVRHIANGVPVPANWPKRGHDFVAGGPLRVAYVGRIEDRQKGVLSLPRIFGGALVEYPDMQFDIVGDGPDLERLRARMAEECPEAGVKFHGALSHDNALALLAEQDVLVMPSRFEGHPIVLLEAMAAGVVPIVSRLEGQTDHVVMPGENGFLVEADDWHGFAGALVEAARNRSRLRRMSEAAWRTAKERFSVERMGESYLRLIEELREQRKTSAARRSGKIDVSLLGDLPRLPVCLVRPIRKMLRMLGLWREERPTPTPECS